MNMINKIFSLIRKVKVKLPVLLFDGVSIPVSWYAAYWLRYNLQPFTSYHPFFALSLLAAVQISCFYYFKIYRGLWRFSSLNDVIRIIQSAIAATTIVIPIYYLTSILQHLPRSVLPLYCLILIAFLCSGRLLVRIYSEKKVHLHLGCETKRVLIVGAGRAGEGLARDLRRNNDYKPVGFVDDSAMKQEFELHGVKVLGKTQDLLRVVQKYDVDLIFIALPSASSATMRRIVGFCEESGIPFRTLPSLRALASGRVAVNFLRPVNIDDLLGRDQVRLDWQRIGGNVSGKRVVVTGGGGSIGSELCRQILSLKPSSLVIIDNSEFNLYLIEQELRARYPERILEVALVSVTDSIAVEHVFARFKPEIVFHAAAYKHVPMLQNQVRIAVNNNIMGTQIVAEASVAHGVKKFILISTDKAVNPTNIMGTTKRVAEIYCQNLNTRVETQFITVRFGNVLGSTGSVVPLFQKQLEAGGPITVTHPDIQRYFMTIPEACQLILQSMVNGQGGEIFVLDMGEPVKITYLAEQMIRLAGKEPGSDIKIEYTGLRPGEKLFEELFHESEQLVTTAHEKLFKARFREIDWNELNQVMRMLKAACTEHQEEELCVLLKNLVPEFQLDPLLVQ